MINSVAETADQAMAAATVILTTWASADPAALRGTNELHGAIRNMSRDHALERGVRSLQRHGARPLTRHSR